MYRKQQGFSLQQRGSGWSRLALALSLAATVWAVEGVVDVGTAAAQTATSQVDADFKGMVGLGMIGAELGFAVPALAGLQETWSFIVFPVVGAAGGGLAGYFALEQSNQVELSVASLALGMALIVPTMVITLSATSYDPEDEGGTSGDDDGSADADGHADIDTDEGFNMNLGGSVGGSTDGEAAPMDVAPVDAAPAEAPPGGDALPPAGGEGGVESPSMKPLASAAPALLRLSGQGLGVGVPTVSVGQVYTPEEVIHYGLQQHTEVQLSVLSGTF